jgi:hypothetical protein
MPELWKALPPADECQRGRDFPCSHDPAERILQATKETSGVPAGTSPFDPKRTLWIPSSGLRAVTVGKACGMTSTKLTPLVVAFVLALTAQGADAASLSPAAGALKESAAGSSLTQQIHGCHYSCECGPLRDFGSERVYHRHLHMLCLPVRCRGQDCDATPPDGVGRHIAPP